EHCGLLKRIKNDVCDEITRQFEYYVYAVADCFNIVLSDQCEQLKSESIKFFHVIEKNNCPINGKEMVYTRICPELKYLVNFVQFKYYMDCYQNKPTNKNNNHHNNHNNDQDITTTTTTTELYPDINNNKNNDDVHNYIDKIDNIDNYIEHNEVCEKIIIQINYYVNAVEDCFNIVLSDQCEQLRLQTSEFLHVIEKNNCPIIGKGMDYVWICPQLEYLFNFVQFKYYKDCLEKKQINNHINHINHNHHNNHNNNQDITTTTTTTTTELYPDINNNNNNDDVYKIDNIDNYIEHVFDL
ncbi:hypothetical protein DERP_011618, partial [Dermatophagoides pteronyssinus]